MTSFGISVNIFVSGQPKKVTGHRKREAESGGKQAKQQAKSLTDPINYERHSEMAKRWSNPLSAVVPCIGSWKPPNKKRSIRRFVFFLVSRSTTFLVMFLCFYFDVLLQFVRPANAFDTGNYLHAVRGSNKLINAYMQCPAEWARKTED